MRKAPYRIVVAAGTPLQASRYKAALESHGFSVRCADGGKDILPTLRESAADLLLLDMELPDCDALAVIRTFTAEDISVPIVVTGQEGINNEKLRAARQRAFVIPPSPGASQLGHIVTTLLDPFPGLLPDKSATLPAAIAGLAPFAAKHANDAEIPGFRDENFGIFIGTSPAMQTLYGQIENAARSPAPVFITGEPGTGKIVCAQAIHKHSPRAGEIFIPLDCAAMPPGLAARVLSGEGGTVFFDELCDCSPAAQAELLHILRSGEGREGKNRPRIICATGSDPLEEIKKGRLREDLFYQLHVLRIIMPPLRLRGDDVLDIALLLLLRFAKEENRRFRNFTADAEKLLRSYSWPGNIRQLQNIIRHAVVMHDGVAMTAQMLSVRMQRGVARPDLPPATESAAAPIIPLPVLERRAIEQAIDACHGNIPRAAALLQISQSTIYRKKSLWEGESGENRSPYGLA